MKPILLIPIAILILLLLFCWMAILIIPLIFLKIVTGKDYSRGWMVQWAEKPLQLCGIKLNNK